MPEPNLLVIAPARGADAALEVEIARLLTTTYGSLQATAAQHGVQLAPTPSPSLYTRSPLAEQLRYLATVTSDPAPVLRHIAALLVGYPPRPVPAPLPDWFWLQMPSLARRLVALQPDQWIPLAAAADWIHCSKQVLLYTCRTGIVLSVLIVVPGSQPPVKRRYLWRPDLETHFTPAIPVPPLHYKGAS